MSLLTRKQLAEALQVNPQTIYRWVKDGIIPQIKVGKSNRYILDDVIQSLKKGK